MYIPVLSGFAARAATTEEGAGAASVVYKRYKLSEEKTFASFFHPDKDPILSLVNQFQDKKGKVTYRSYITCFLYRHSDGDSDSSTLS